MFYTELFTGVVGTAMQSGDGARTFLTSGASLAGIDLYYGE